MQSMARCGLSLGAGIAISAAANVHAQFVTSTKHAEGLGDYLRLSIVPSLSISETLTDNSRLSNTNRQADLISQVVPRIRMSSSGGRVKGFLDYSLTGIAYAKNTAASEFQNGLNSLVNVEAVENWAFVDFAANISQQSISAYGTRSADAGFVNGNRTEVRTFTVSPYVKGRLGDSADYEARWAQNWTRNSSNSAADNNSSLATLRVAGDHDRRLLGWAAEASHQSYDFINSRRSVDDIIRGVLYVAPDPQLRFSLTVGRESTDIVSAERKSENVTGFGVNWYPEKTTQLSAQREKRFFGNSHAVEFVHRTPHTVWRFSDVQDVTNGFGQSLPGSLGTAYDLFFIQFASIQPDPVQRAALVDAFLRANGIAPSAELFNGSLASAVTRQRRQSFSFAWIGVRDTLTFAASQTQGLRLDDRVTVSDDFANGNLVRQKGVSLAVSHRMTPLATLNFLAAIDRTSGNSSLQITTLRSVGLYWTNQWNPRSNVSLGVRHSAYSSTTDPYTETAVTATVGLRF